MATTISVNKQSVLDLLSTGKDKPFIIPEYQRPYAWIDEQIEALFVDIWEFATTVGGLDRSGTYFLGSVVSFENENGEQEIIDGQQRITSLFLLLRAIYTKLVKGDNADNEAAKNFIGKIEPAIWRTDNRTGKVNYQNILITSRVVDNSGNEILRKILETGIADPNATDNYSKNYLMFQKLFDKYCTDYPLFIYDFIFALLNQAILLPITADSQDTALTIFSTLNNRGLQLSDSDIFKAKIYNHLKDGEKDSFIAKWQTLEKEASEAQESIQRLFYYYMFYLRAKEGDVSSTTPGVRKYYLADKCQRLYDPNLLSDLDKVLTLWKVINCNHDIPEEAWDNNPKIRKALDTLVSYPNEYWKYPVITYFLAHRNDNDFEKEFLLFLNKLCGELMSRFVLFPTINAVKSDIMKLNAKIIKDSHPDFDFKPVDVSMVEDKIKIPHRSIVRMLLKSYAYIYQDNLLPDNWQIEHILPQKWQDSFFPDVEPKIVNEMIEHIGNKTPFERKLNIVASNGYFNKKQAEYQKSDIQVTKILVTTVANDWVLANIEQRDKIVANEISKAMESWETEYNNYSNTPKTAAPTPTPEELAMIQKFKAQGWVK